MDITLDTAEQALCTRFATAVGQGASAIRHACVPARATFIVQIGATRFLLKIVDGQVADLTRAIPLCCATDFVVRAPADAWDDLWQPVPRAGRHDIFALMKSGDMQIEGNMQVVFASLQYFKDLLALPRAA